MEMPVNNTARKLSHHGLPFGQPPCLCTPLCQAAGSVRIPRIYTSWCGMGKVRMEEYLATRTDLDIHRTMAIR
eukprot:4303378-Amphidinium_carterae.1